MKKFLLTVLSVFFAVSLSVAQYVPPGFDKHDTVAYYMKNSQDIAKSETDADFLRLLIKSDSGLYIVQDYYMDAKPKLLAKSFNGNMNFEGGTHGEYLEFYQNGNKKNVRNYNKGQLAGESIEYYPNGQLYTIVNYDNNIPYLKKCQDSTGKVLADNGIGRWVKLSERYPKVTLTGPIVHGREEGIWIKTFSDATAAKIEYKNGAIIDGDQYVRSADDPFSSVEIGPKFPGGDIEFARFLSRRIKYPEKASRDKVQGRVILRFVVDTDGSLKDVRVVRGIGSGCDEEAIRVIKSSPKWLPGIQDNKPVRTEYSVPVEFSIGNSQPNLFN